MSRTICWILYIVLAVLIVLMGMESRAQCGVVHGTGRPIKEQDQADYLSKYNMALDRTFVVVVLTEEYLDFGAAAHGGLVVEGVCEKWDDPIFGDRTCSETLGFEQYVKKYLGSRYYIVGGYYDKGNREITLYVNRTKLKKGKK